MAYFDRYNNFRVNGAMKPIPGLILPPLSSDKQIIYELGKSRLDIISNQYYNSPYYGWLILLANQEFGGLEFNIKDQSILTIPFPFESAIERYITSINTYKSLYGEQ